MDNVIDELVRLNMRCRRAATALLDAKRTALLDTITGACNEVGKSWSGSWIGYQASLYIEGFRPPRPGEHFDSEWGFDEVVSKTRGNWRQYDADIVVAEIERRAGMSGKEFDEFAQAADEAKQVFEACKKDVLPLLDAVLSERQDKIVADKRDEIAKLKSHTNATSYLRAMMPAQLMSRDHIAIQAGAGTPPHLGHHVCYLEFASFADHLTSMADAVEYIAKYMTRRLNMVGKSAAKTQGSIFIGHGHSLLWRELKDFVVERLDRDFEEFNRIPTAGISTKERLEEMLDTCCFAFVVMTAEDEQKDGNSRARQNVIHEIGLFQGRFGFERAIVLLEDGCDQFSNIDGIGQIRFPKGNICACFEEIRKVLEREKIVV